MRHVHLPAQIGAMAQSIAEVPDAHGPLAHMAPPHVDLMQV
jgi:hypothetical protein